MFEIGIISRWMVDEVYPKYFRKAMLLVKNHGVVVGREMHSSIKCFSGNIAVGNRQTV